MTTRDKLRDAINDSFIIQGELESLSEKISSVIAGIDKDKAEIGKLDKIKARVSENEGILKGLQDEQAAKVKEMADLKKVLDDNNVKLPFPVKQTQKTKI